MRLFGKMMMTASVIAGFCICSTDDYFTMELDQAHNISWAAVIITMAVGAAGLALDRIAEARR